MSEISLNPIVFSAILYFYSDINVHKRRTVKRINASANSCAGCFHRFFRPKPSAFIFATKWKQRPSAYLLNFLNGHEHKYKMDAIRTVEKRNQKKNFKRNIRNSDAASVTSGVEKKSKRQFSSSKGFAS